MPFYVYRAITSEGKVSRSSGYFVSLDDLVDDVDRRGDTLFSCYASPAPLEWVGKLLGGKLSAAEVLDFCQFVAQYLDAGADLPMALNDLRSTGRFPRVKNKARQLGRLLEAGFTLSDSLIRVGGFPVFVTSMVDIGEKTGTLPTVLRSVAEHYEQLIALRKAVVQASIYPLVVLLVMMGSMGFWLTMVVPNITGLFQATGTKLPAVTQSVMDTTSWLSKYWALLPVALAVPIVALVALLRDPRTRPYIDKLAWHMPVFGGVGRKQTYAHFFRSMGVMYGAGLPIGAAFELAQGNSYNRQFLDAMAQVRQQVNSGHPLAASALRSKAFDPLAVHLMGLGERTGTLAEQFVRLSKHYAVQTKASIDVATKLAEPAILLLVGGLFVFLVGALLLPVYDIITSVSGQVSL
jgi:type II secretory pathway component PulF